tara:strand:- start:4699 stop:5013 length:315 start_codon:yes stop_codon:yes gene_type:complete
MSSKEDFAVKITKGNFTKNVMDIFSSKIDCDKKYKLKDLRDILNLSYKEIKDKKVVTKKPPSEYNIFVRDQTKELKEKNPTLDNKEIFKKIAELWNEYKKNKTM